MPKPLDTFALSFRVYNVLAGTPGNTTLYRDTLPKGSFSLQRIRAFNRAMEKLLAKLERIYQRGKPAIGAAESYWATHVVKNKLNEDIGWHAYLRQIHADLWYFSDRWCYERYVTLRREWELFKYSHYWATRKD